MAHRSTRLSRRTAAAVGLLTLCGMLSGCANDSAVDDEVTIGYFANVTHAPALIADGTGLFGERRDPLQLAPDPRASAHLALRRRA